MRREKDDFTPTELDSQIVAKIEATYDKFVTNMKDKTKKLSEFQKEIIATWSLLLGRDELA